jgi:hypothetical protein
MYDSSGPDFFDFIAAADDFESRKSGQLADILDCRAEKTTRDVFEGDGFFSTKLKRGGKENERQNGSVFVSEPVGITFAPVRDGTILRKTTERGHGLITLLTDFATATITAALKARLPHLAPPRRWSTSATALNP